MQVAWRDTFLGIFPASVWIAAGIIVLGLIVAYIVRVLIRRGLRRAGVPEVIEGTDFERTARALGSSTVDIIAKLGSYFVFLLAVFTALSLGRLQFISLFWSYSTVFLPELFIALLILIVGVVVGDKVELLVAERLRGVKLPEIGLIPLAAKYSVFYIAALIALSQVGVATLALIVLLGVYGFGLVLFSVLAFKELLASGAAGIYLLLHQPYGIGDEVKLGDQRGVVQEVNMFMTHIETDAEEYIIPNNKVFREGIVRIVE